MSVVLVIRFASRTFKGFEVAFDGRPKRLVPGPPNAWTMKRLLIHGDPGVRQDDTIEHAGEEYVAFSVSRNGDWHGPDRPQLWCIVGEETEREVFDAQRYIPHFLETEATDADAISVRK